MATWLEVQNSVEFKGLNPEEQGIVQKRYFDNVISQDADFKALTQTEQLATQNRFFGQGPMGQQEQNNETISQLMQTMKGELPVSQRDIPRGLPLSPELGIIEPQRQEAFNQLRRLGLTPRQIELSLQTQKALGRPRVGRTAGGISGALATTAIAGRLIPGPIDDAGIMAALIIAGGAGVGGAAGEAIQTGIEEKRLISKREALGAFAIEAGTELGARAVVRTGKFVLSPFIKKTVPEAAALIDDYAKVGGSFSPSELDRRFTVQVGEAFSRGSFGAKQIFQEFEETQGKAALAFADSIIDNISQGVTRQTTEEIGDLFAEGITRPNGRIFNLFDDLINPLYKQVDDLTRKGAKVSTKGLKAFAKRHLATDNRLNKQFLSPIGRNKLQKIAGMKDTLSFSDMRTLRSSFLKDARKLARDVDQSQGIIKQLAGIADNAIFDPKAAQGLSPEALNLLRNTNALYKAGQEGIKTTFSEKLAKRLLKNPSAVTKELFKPKNPKAIRNLRKSLIEPISGKPSAEGKILWDQLRQAWLAETVDQATKEGVVKPRVFDKLIRQIGDEGLREIFPEKESIAGVRKIQALFNVAGKAPPSGTSLFSRSAQVGGLALMYKSGKEGDFIGFTAGATLAMGPLAFAKLATNPRGIKLLTAGFKMKPGASGLVPNTIRMVKLLRDINRKEQKETLQLETQKIRKRQAARMPTLPQLRGFGGRGF